MLLQLQGLGKNPPIRETMPSRVNMTFGVANTIVHDGIGRN